MSGKLLGQIRWLWNLPNKLFGDYNTNFSEATFLLEFGLLGRPQLSLVLFYSKKEVGASWMWCQCFDIFSIMIFSLSLSTRDWTRCEAGSALNVMPVLWYVLNNYFFTFTFYWRLEQVWSTECIKCDASALISHSTHFYQSFAQPFNKQIIREPLKYYFVDFFPVRRAKNSVLYQKYLLLHIFCWIGGSQPILSPLRKNPPNSIWKAP